MDEERRQAIVETLTDKRGLPKALAIEIANDVHASEAFGRIQDAADMATVCDELREHIQHKSMCLAAFERFRQEGYTNRLVADDAPDGARVWVRAVMTEEAVNLILDCLMKHSESTNVQVSGLRILHEVCYAATEYGLPNAVPFVGVLASRGIQVVSSILSMCPDDFDTQRAAFVLLRRIGRKREWLNENDMLRTFVYNILQNNILSLTAAVIERYWNNFSMRLQVHMALVMFVGGRPRLGSNREVIQDAGQDVPSDIIRAAKSDMRALLDHADLRIGVSWNDDPHAYIALFRELSDILSTIE